MYIASKSQLLSGEKAWFRVVHTHLPVELSVWTNAGDAATTEDKDAVKHWSLRAGGQRGLGRRSGGSDKEVHKSPPSSPSPTAGSTEVQLERTIVEGTVERREHNLFMSDKHQRLVLVIVFEKKL